jgi:hypothetical protein
MIASGEHRDQLKCGAALMLGDVDIEGPIGMIVQAVTGDQGAIFSARNKPASENEHAIKVAGRHARW